MATRINGTKSKPAGHPTKLDASNPSEELKRLVTDYIRAAMACTESEALKRSMLIATANHNLNYLRRRNLENWFRPLVPEVGDATGREFWSQLRAKLRRDFQITRAEFDDFDDDGVELHALLSSANPAGKVRPLSRGARRETWLDQKVLDEGWSQKELEAKTGLVYNTLRRYCSGKKSNQDRTVRRALATAFKCKLAEVPE